MKKIIAAVIALNLLFACVSADTIYEKSTSETVTRGLVHTYTERMTSSGWQKIHVLTADLTDENISVVPLYDLRGISYKTTVRNMTASGSAVAGINADFFDFNTPSGRATPLGLTVKDSKIVSTSAHDTGLASLVLSGNRAVADYFKTEVYLCAENGNKTQILHINKYHPTDSIVMFTPDWGAQTPGTLDGSCEMVVEDGVVSAFKTGDEPTDIPENGYVLRVNPAINNFFAENYEVGDKASIEVSISPDVKNIDTAVGGGTILVKNGKTAQFTNNISGYNPRSAAGISKDGKTLYLVTVEGREKNTRGMTQTELAQLMISLGSYSAINFDGGGSTTMAIRSENGDISLANTPSDGAERYVSTGIGVKSVGQNAHFASLKLTLSKENVFVGDSIEIWSAPYDSLMNPTILEYPLEYSADDGGKFTENKYFPSKAGKRTVTVTAGDVSAQIKINVLDRVSNLTFYPSFFTGNSAYLCVIAADNDGFKSQIEPENVTWRVESGNAQVSSGQVSCTGAVTVSASFGGKTAYCYGNTQNVQKLIGRIYDPMQAAVSNPSFVVMPAKLTPNTFLNCITDNFLEQKAKKAPLAFTFGAYNTETTALTAFSNTSDGDSEYICLNNDKTVFEGGASQWSALTKAVKTPAKNVFVFLTNTNAFQDSAEASMFEDILGDMFLSGKNVFVISCGTQTEVNIENGIHYITLKKLPSVDLGDFEYSSKSTNYLKFRVDGTKVQYEIAGIFE